MGEILGEPKHTRLQHRKAGYYLRARVPDDVRPIICNPTIMKPRNPQ